VAHDNSRISISIFSDEMLHILSAVRCGNDVFLCCLIIGILILQISTPSSLLMFLELSLM